MTCFVAETASRVQRVAGRGATSKGSAAIAKAVDMTPPPTIHSGNATRVSAKAW